MKLVSVSAWLPFADSGLDLQLQPKVSIPFYKKTKYFSFCNVFVANFNFTSFHLRFFSIVYYAMQFFPFSFKRPLMVNVLQHRIEAAFSRSGPTSSFSSW